MLVQEFLRAGIVFEYRNRPIIDPFLIYTKYEPRNLESVYKRLTGKELEGAHGALVDIIGTKEIADILIPKLQDLSETPLDYVKHIDEYMQGDKRRFDLAGKMYVDVDGIVKWNFSKNKDKAVLTDMGFVNWFMGQGFPQESKNKIKELQQIKTNHE
jgi:DNA polymerase-3 subunit epsilon